MFQLRYRWRIWLNDWADSKYEVSSEHGSGWGCGSGTAEAFSVQKWNESGIFPRLCNSFTANVIVWAWSSEFVFILSAVQLFQSDDKLWSESQLLNMRTRLKGNVSSRGLPRGWNGKKTSRAERECEKCAHTPTSWVSLLSTRMTSPSLNGRMPASEGAWLAIATAWWEMRIVEWYFFF